MDGLVLNCPRRALVTVELPGFFMPRMDIQECSAWTTTATPGGCNSLSIRFAISSVIRSCSPLACQCADKLDPEAAVLKGLSVRRDAGRMV